MIANGQNLREKLNKYYTHRKTLSSDLKWNNNVDDISGRAEKDELEAPNLN